MDPILLIPGINCASDGFIANYENSSLAFYLANNDFDVWIMNNRGNKYDVDHHKNKSLDKKSKEYWDFSFEEMALEDLPKVIEYIEKKIS